MKVLFLKITLAAALALSPAVVWGAEPVAGRHMIVAAEGAAAEAGLEMLRAGGSAVDAPSPRNWC